MNLAASGSRFPSDEHVLAVIPARLGATRLPGKPLRLVGGLPLVVRVYRRVEAFALGLDVVVATDAREVAEVCANHNVPCVITDHSHPSGTDRVAEVARRPEFRDATIIVNVQGDEPFVPEAALLGAVRMITDGIAPIGTVGAHADASILGEPDVVKVVRDDRQRALYFSRAPIPFLRDRTDGELHTENVLQHIGVYAYTRDALEQWVTLPVHPLEQIERLEQLRPLAHGIAIGVAVLDHAPARGIDTEADLAQANEFLATSDAVAVTT